MIPLSAFLSSYNSAYFGAQYRNVGEQGGNHMLAAAPLAAQATWAGTLIAGVTASVEGPLYGITQFFRILFHPFISFPLSFTASAIKEGFYEKGVSATAAASRTFYVRGEEAEQHIRGTVALSINGVPRHFVLGDVIPDHVVEAGECKKPFVKRREVDGYEVYYELKREVPQPIQGTMVVEEEGKFKHYFLKEVQEEVSGSLQIISSEQTLFYDPGEEIDAPEPGSYSFIIDGVERHFRTAKYTPTQTQGLSGYLNMLTEKHLHCSIFPIHLSRMVRAGWTFISEHLSRIIQVAVLVTGVAFLYFGQTAMAVGTLAACVYEYLDHSLGVIPQGVSLFIEEWLPTFSMIVLLFVGDLLSQVFAALYLLSMVPGVGLFVHHQASKICRFIQISIDELIFRGLGGRGGGLLDAMRAFPSLEECDAPHSSGKKNMNAGEIEEILNARDQEYEINPSILTKEMQPLIQYVEDHEFTKLIDLWDQVGIERWSSSYPQLFLRLIGDKRFIKFLQENGFPQAKRFFFEYDSTDREKTRGEQYRAAEDTYRKTIDSWIVQLAEKQNVSKEQFVAEYLKQQLQKFVDKLKGNSPVQADQKYLKEAIQNTSRLLPFLLKEKDKVSLEDALIQLAVEGGDYCTLALRRVSKEVLRGFTHEVVVRLEQDLDPQQRFEREVLRGFQDERLSTLQDMIQKSVAVLKDMEGFQDTAEDVHLYTFVERRLKRGVYPMTQEEMDEFSLQDVIQNETSWLMARALWMQKFKERVPNAMREWGIDHDRTFYDAEQHKIHRNRTLDYLRNWVMGNPSLNDEEKYRLLNGPLLMNAEQLATAENHPKWDRLFLTVLGFYRKKQALPVVQSEAAPNFVPAMAMA